MGDYVIACAWVQRGDLLPLPGQLSRAGLRRYILLHWRMDWHDANISKFVEAWKDYVDPAGAAGPAAGAQPQGSAGLDYTLPE